MAPAAQLQYGPRRTPIRIAWFLGAGACLLGLPFVALGLATAHQDIFYLWFFGLLGLLITAFGIYMMFSGHAIAKLRADVRTEALHLIAHRGRHLTFQLGLAEATIPWSEIQGLSTMRTLNMNTKTRTQITYILYSKRGDFTLNDIQWDNLAGLVREISVRTGRAVGKIAPERNATRIAVEAGKRRVFKAQRILGWIVVGVCVPALLLLILGGLIQGYSVALLDAGFMLMLAISLGSALIRFYRK
jgi:hypothetical protein